MEITTITTRRMTPPNKKFWFTTNHFKTEATSFSGGHHNCLYLHFCKDDFPKIASPPTRESAVFGKCFEYGESILQKLDFHGGITFYEEQKNEANGKVYVKVGCDYQHLGDDAYMAGDYGHVILTNDAPKLAEQFEQLVKELQ